MVIKLLDVNKYLFQPQEDDEKLLGLEVPNLSAISVLIYLTNNIRSYITFSMNLLARFNSFPI
jgi:hypothetical protein